MMKRTTSLTLATLIVAVAATSAAPALAQDSPGNGQRQMRHELRGPGPGGDNRGGMIHEERGMMRGGGLLALVCDEQGADRLEHMLLTVAQRTDLTAEQQPLHDALKTAALTAQSDFAAACAAARPAEGADVSSTDLADRLKARLDIEKAHVAALEGVIPAFEAFYDSLSDAQKQALTPPQRGERRDIGEHHDKPGDRRAPAPDAPQEQG
jgi:hypothetical protein